MEVIAPTDVESCIDMQTTPAANDKEVELHMHEAKRTLEQPNASFAPHEWLPREVMQHIFVIYAGTSGIPSLPFDKAEHPAQLTLSHVCSSWRQLALGSGALWNNVAISKFDERSLDMAADWLARARNTPVAVKITLFKSPFLDLSNVFKALLSPLRLTHLDLMLSSAQLGQLSTLPVETFPHLEQLRVILHGQKYSPPVSPRSFLAHTQHLLCASGPCPEFLHTGCFPIRQLRHLDLQCVELTPPQCFSILRAAPLLEACRFLWYWEWDGAEALVQKDLVLPNMKVLSLEFHRQRRDSIVFDALTSYVVLPNLRKLSIHYRGLGGDLISTMAERFNFSQLEELELRKTSPMMAQEVFAFTPSLRRVTLSKNVLIDEATMDAISIGKFAPHLQSMKTNYMCDAEAVFRMIEARWKASSNTEEYKRADCQRMRHVDFRCPGPDIYGKKLHALKQLGIRVVMNDYLNRHKPLSSEPGANDIWTKFVRPLHT